MNEKISYIKLPNITVSELQDVVDFLDDNGIEYVEYYVEDLQNRIDKAINCIEKFPLIHYSSVEKIDSKRLSGKLIPVDELLNILKESGE